jgi:hypothetical protein
VTTAHDQVRRPLTDNELTRLLAEVAEATDTTDLFTRTVRGVFTPLLADLGRTFDDVSPLNPLDATRFAIPAAQWQTLMQAVADRAGQWGTAAMVTLELTNVLPSAYDDPTVAVPVAPRVDRRPPIHDLRFTREATDVIRACEEHLHALAAHYGRGSAYHLDALTSWHGHLARLTDMGFGANTQVRADGPLSLQVTTASGLLYAIVFHPARRRCTTSGCLTVIDDDGTARPAHRHAPVFDHRHTPSYPLDGPRPGVWSFHS